LKIHKESGKQKLDQSSKIQTRPVKTTQQYIAQSTIFTAHQSIHEKEK
jgi:hypothetical protein